jgi:hypothetical protein
MNQRDRGLEVARVERAVRRPQDLLARRHAANSSAQTGAGTTTIGPARRRRAKGGAGSAVADHSDRMRNASACGSQRSTRTFPGVSGKASRFAPCPTVNRTRTGRPAAPARES